MDVCFLCELTQTIVRDGKANTDSLKVLLTANTNVNGKSKSYASKQTVTKIGESGLELNHFELNFKQGGFEGHRVLLSELYSTGKKRVTKPKMIIKNLSAYFEKQNVNVK